MSGMLFRVALKLDISGVHLHFKYRVCISRIQCSLVGNYLGGGLSQALPCPLPFSTESTHFPHRMGAGVGCAGMCPGVPAQEEGYRGAAFPRQAQFPSSIEHFLWYNLKLSTFNFPKVCFIISDF